MTLWSTYWTARSTRTRGTPSCSNCMNAIVPVASWSSVWSIRSPIGEPGSRSPSTRCSRRMRRLRLSADVFALDQLRDDLVDPVDPDRVELALHVGPLGGVHAHEPGLAVHERAARVALVDHRVSEDHVAVGADGRVARALARDLREGRADGRDHTGRSGEIRVLALLALRQVDRGRIANAHHAVADLQLLLARNARHRLEALAVLDLEHRDVVAERLAEQLG